MRENCVIDLEQWLSKILTVTHRERDILHHDYFPAGIYLWMYDCVHACLFIYKMVLTLTICDTLYFLGFFWW